MQTIVPEFMKWVEVGENGWVLNDESPEHIEYEFDRYMFLFRVGK